MGGRRRKRGAPDPVRFSKKVVTAVLLSVAAFTVAMILLFLRVGAVPDTLVMSFFAFAGGEAGVLGLIRFSESKYDKTSTNDSAAGGGSPAG